MKSVRKLVASVAFLSIASMVVIFAVSNRAEVPISLWPLPFYVSLRLSVALLGALAIGIVLGGAIAWTSGARLRLQRPPPQPSSPNAARPTNFDDNRPKKSDSYRLPSSVDRDCLKG